MKKFKPLDIILIIMLTVVLVFAVILLVRDYTDESKQAQLTFFMSEDIDSAKYLKIGGDVYLETGEYLGIVSAVKAPETGGITITVSVKANTDYGKITVSGVDIKLDKEYTLITKRLSAKTVCVQIEEESK